MKKLIVLSALAALFSTATFAQTTASQSFTVSASLAARCVSNITGTPDINFGQYTAFSGPATTAPSAAISFRCTRNLATAPVATLNSTTGSIAGLDYSLTLVAGTKTTGTGAATTTGSYDVYPYTVTGSMASGQAGDANITPVAVTHTLTISY